MLPESVVGTALWRGPVKVASPGVGGEGLAIPLLDGIRRVCQDNVERHQAVALQELGLGKCVAADDLEILDSVEEAIHPGYRGCHQVSFLPEETHIAPL